MRYRDPTISSLVSDTTTSFDMPEDAVLASVKFDSDVDVAIPGAFLAMDRFVDIVGVCGIDMPPKG
jgi:hypothetical protein